MKNVRPRAWQSVLVLAALSPILLDGCVSIGVSRSQEAGAEAATGSLEVTVVEKSDDVRPTASRVVTRLVRLESGIEQPVAESSDSTWTKSDLPPARYRLHVSHWIDESGQSHRFGKSDQESFRIHPGDRVQARVVLKAFPTGPVVTGAVLVGVAIAVAVFVATFRVWKSDWNGNNLSDGNRKCDRKQRERSRGPIPFLR
jgi:hypothetical protein